VHKKRLRVFCEVKATFKSLCKDILLEYKQLDPPSFRYDAVKGTVEVRGAVFSVNELSGNDLKQIFPDTEPLCIVLDELDRVKNKDVIQDLAELAKNFSTYRQNITFLLIGVASTADELLAGHASNIRNLRQVSLDRMEEGELRAIIARGGTILSVEFEAAVEKRIIVLCDQMPYYLHLIASNAAKCALERDSAIVQTSDLNKGIKSAAADADHSLRAVYDHAILAKRGSDIYRQILWGLADMPRTAHIASSVATESNRIAVSEGGAEVTVPAVGQALKKLTTDEKRNILMSRTSGYYSFSDPLMKGFVKLMKEQR
jgi:hypothetical protein